MANSKAPKYEVLSVTLLLVKPASLLIKDRYPSCAKKYTQPVRSLQTIRSLQITKAGRFDSGLVMASLDPFRLGLEFHHDSTDLI